MRRNPLDLWAEAHGHDRGALCAMLDVSDSTICMWFSGKRRPSREKRLLIEAVTGGAVTAIDLDKWEPGETA